MFPQMLPIPLSHVLPQMILGAAPAAGGAGGCTDAFVSTLVSGLSVIINILMGLGVAVAVIGIVVGGLLRATAWGNEQKVVMSNKAITAAVVGLVIVLIAVTLGNQVPVWFGQAGNSCTVAPKTGP